MRAAAAAAFGSRRYICLSVILSSRPVVYLVVWTRETEPEGEKTSYFSTILSRIAQSSVIGRSWRAASFFRFSTQLFSIFQSKK